MKVVILAGGFGTRLTEETTKVPKPMVLIDSKPILWHIMKIYSHFGFNQFIICLGYKGHLIKEYFYNYYMHNSDMTVFLRDNHVTYHSSDSEDWEITLVDTGIQSGTAKRISLVKPYIDSDIFFMTYGDGVGNIPIDKLLTHHQKQNRLVTVTSVKPSARFGALAFSSDDPYQVVSVREKDPLDATYINGGFFVLNYDIFKILQDIDTGCMFEKDILPNLASNNQLTAFYHNQFWYCVDTLHDLYYLQNLANSNSYPWLEFSHV